MIQIVTDSTSDLEIEEYKKLGVVCIPLGVCFDGKEYQECKNLTKDKLFEIC